MSANDFEIPFFNTKSSPSKATTKNNSRNEQKSLPPILSISKLQSAIIDQQKEMNKLESQRRLINFKIKKQQTYNIPTLNTQSEPDEDQESNDYEQSSYLKPVRFQVKVEKKFYPEMIKSESRNKEYMMDSPQFEELNDINQMKRKLKFANHQKKFMQTQYFGGGHKREYYVQGLQTSKMKLNSRNDAGCSFHTDRNKDKSLNYKTDEINPNRSVVIENTQKLQQHFFNTNIKLNVLTSNHNSINSSQNGPFQLKQVAKIDMSPPPVEKCKQFITAKHPFFLDFMRKLQKQKYKYFEIGDKQPPKKQLNLPAASTILLNASVDDIKNQHQQQQSQHAQHHTISNTHDDSNDYQISQQRQKNVRINGSNQNENQNLLRKRNLQFFLQRQQQVNQLIS